MIKDTFSTAQKYAGDVYVVDYTNSTNNLRGVEILQEVPNDISYFHLINKKSVHYWGINLEKHKKFFDKQRQCECMFISSDSPRKPWVCLVELKYCLEKNIGTNADSAFEQLVATKNKLIDEKLISENSKIYLNISIPEYSIKEPFTSFLTSPNEYLLSVKKDNVHILGYNSLLILNETYINVPKQKI